MVFCYKTFTQNYSGAFYSDMKSICKCGLLKYQKCSKFTCEPGTLCKQTGSRFEISIIVCVELYFQRSVKKKMLYMHKKLEPRI